MNKKGQGLSMIGISIMVALFLFMIGMSQIGFLTDLVTSVRGVNNLSCSLNTISDGEKLTCLLVDIVVPFFIITIISATGGIVTARLLT